MTLHLVDIQANLVEAWKQAFFPFPVAGIKTLLNRTRNLPMREQTAILAQDHGKWIFVVDSDKEGPERTWKDVDEAFGELRREGWEVVQGPAPIRSSFGELEELERFAPWGYRLRRVIQ